MKRALTAPILAGAILVCSSLAHAQSSAAEALFDEGRKALAAGDLDTACSRFRASDQIDSAAGTRANLGDCEEKRGKVASAWEAFRGALAKLPPGDSRIPIVQKRIHALETRLPKLVLTLAPGVPKETTVREGEATIGSATTFGIPLPLDPGMHHLSVIGPGRSPRNFDVTLNEGKTTTFVVELETVEPPARDAANERTDAVRAPDGRRRVQVRSDVPGVTLYAVSADGAKPLCRVPCDRFVTPAANQMFFVAGDGVTASDTFALEASETRVRVQAGSLSRRRGGIAMLVLGSLATLGGGVVAGLGANATLVCNDPYPYSCGTGVSAPVVGGGVGLIVTGIGLIVGGAVLVRQGRTTIQMVDTKGAASEMPALIRF
jgi:hypothetical protein